MSKLADFNTLAEAKAHSQVVGKLIPRTTMNSLLAQFGLFNAFEAAAQTDDRFAAFMHPSSIEYNFIQGSTTGDAQIAMLDAIIADGAFPSLPALKAAVIAIANPVTYPFSGATKHDFDKAKVSMAYTTVTPQGGWLKITTTADCEAHRPQIYATIQGVRRRVAGFDTVELAGEYLAQVPSQYETLEVDNAYGVVG